MRWNTPLSDEHAIRLLERFELLPGQAVLDLGCGSGELLIAAVAAVAAAGDGGCTGVGVDLDQQLLERGRLRAAERGLGGGRLTFVRDDARAWRDPGDRVISIGASHAWGGTEAALRGLAEVVPRGGRLLCGGGCWETAPSEAAATLFGTSVLPLAEVVRCAGATGWRVLWLSTADQREWDDFESSWRAGRHAWRSAHPDHPRRLRSSRSSRPNSPSTSRHTVASWDSAT
ncbi:MAG TPA: class I SAM-dependent methyltransferase [Gaiellales bacterium]|nr:class I SAM-dependent methyltransferase [Gaiellales bacterium]